MIDKCAEKDFNVIGDIFFCTKLLHLVKKFQDANVGHDIDLNSSRNPGKNRPIGISELLERTTSDAVIDVRGWAGLALAYFQPGVRAYPPHYGMAHTRLTSMKRFTNLKVNLTVE